MQIALCICFFFISIMILEVIALSSKFVISPKEDKTVNITVRVKKDTQEKFDEIARKSNRSRNELINMALEYALNNLEFIENTDKK